MMKGKLGHDPQTIASFDIIGTFFVDAFYNKIYVKSKEAFLRGGTGTLTEIYTQHSLSYIKSLMSSVQVYKDTVSRLHEFYALKRTVSAMPFTVFENDVVSCFFPKDSVKLMTNRDKDAVLKEVVCQTTSDFVSYLLSPAMLRKVIDEHSDVANVRILQDKYIMLFVAKRDTYHERIKRHYDGKGDGMVSQGAYENLYEKVVAEAKTHMITKKTLASLQADDIENKKIIEALKIKLREALSEINELRAHITQLQHERSKPAQTEPRPRPSYQSQVEQPRAEQPQPFHRPAIEQPKQVQIEQPITLTDSTKLSSVANALADLPDVVEQPDITQSDIDPLPSWTDVPKPQQDYSQGESDDHFVVSDVTDTW